jgi:hypothetical protein
VKASPNLLVRRCFAASPRARYEKARFGKVIYQHRDGVTAVPDIKLAVRPRCQIWEIESFVRVADDPPGALADGHHDTAKQTSSARDQQWALPGKLYTWQRPSGLSTRDALPLLSVLLPLSNGDAILPE